jgi:hypothetical protein
VADFTIKQNDRAPSITSFLKQAGVAINLTGSTVKFLMKNRDTGTVKVNATATVVTALTGEVRYDWGASDTDTAGNYFAEWEITAGGLKTTCPNGRYLDITVLPEIG